MTERVGKIGNEKEEKGGVGIEMGNEKEEQKRRKKRTELRLLLRNAEGSCDES